MPLAPGGDLAQAIRAAGPGGLPEARVRELIVGILEGLAFAHGQGVVHRDIKPGNILFDADDRPMLADFGLSVHAASGAPGDQSVVRRSMALSTGGEAPGGGGHVVGTLAYMAPEVREGREATAASDIYSLGVMLFEMLVGRRPSGLELPSMARKGLEASALWDALYRRPPLPDDLNEALRVGWREIHQLKEQLAKTEKELAPLLEIYENFHPEVQKKRFAVQTIEQSVTEAIERFRESGARIISNIIERIHALESRRKTLRLEGLKDKHPDILQIDRGLAVMRNRLQEAE